MCNYTTLTHSSTSCTIGCTCTTLISLPHHVRDQYLDKWDWGQGRILAPNPNLVVVKQREEVRSQWRLHYHKHAVWARRISSTTSNAIAPSPPSMAEPPEIDELLDELLINFEAATSINLHTLTNFRHDPRDSLHMSATRFNRVASAIEYHHIMSSRSLALALLHHLLVAAKVTL